jgi:uncharacterized damage-inducible protein DinB
VIDALADAWRANCAINHELLALCRDEDLDLKPGKGKTIRSNFVHIAGVRRSHIEEKLRAEAVSIPKPDWQTATREELAAALTSTDDLVVLLLERIALKPGRWTPARFLGYMVSHDAHHRSQIEMALRLNGREPEDKYLYELWNWPKKAQETSFT